MIGYYVVSFKKWMKNFCSILKEIILNNKFIYDISNEILL